jgi:DnaJ-class molecular chaperone
MLPVVAAVLLLQSDPGALAAKIARGFSEPDKVDAADESAGRSASAFGPRFAVLLLDLHRAVERGRGIERVYRSMIQFSGGPAGSAELIRSLSTNLKKAAYCGDCKDGRVPCAECKGKGKIDWLKCKVCSGEGRYRPVSAVGATDLTVKCRNCDGHGGFRNVGCAACSKTTTIPCPTCLGRPWFDRECSVPDCTAGRVKCESCRGRGRIEITCPTCEGKGRNRASGATPNADVTVKCRGCEGKGKLQEPAPCPSCDATGRVPCKTCRSDGPVASQRRVTISSILTLTPCGECAGKGGGCVPCSGLGVRVRPAGAN